MWWRVCWGRPGRRRSSAPAPAWAHSRSRGLPRPPARVGAGRSGAPSRCPSRPAPPAPRPTGRAVLRTTPAWKRPLTRPVRKGLAPRDPASQFYQWSRGPIFGSGARSSTNRASVCPPGWRHRPTPPTARAAPPISRRPPGPLVTRRLSLPLSLYFLFIYCITMPLLHLFEYYFIIRKNSSVYWPLLNFCKYETITFYK